MLQEIINTAQARIIDFLADNMKYDYSITEIAKQTKTSRPTVYATLERLEKDNMIKNTRMTGQSKLYTLNTDNDIIQSILKVKMELKVLKEKE